VGWPKVKIQIVVEVDTEDREKLGQVLGRDKPADLLTCLAALRSAAEAEKDSWYIAAAEKRERDSDQEYREYKEEVRKRCGER